MASTYSDTSNSSKVTVGNTSTAVIVANNSRVGAVFCNDSDEAIYLAFGEAAVVGEGIRLNATGGTYVMDGNNLNVQAVNAICSSGNKSLAFTEFYNT